jgi:hypothetical protein
LIDSIKSWVDGKEGRKEGRIERLDVDFGLPAWGEAGG